MVVVLALAVNAEPNRLGVIALLLIRPRPIRQLLTFLCASFVVSATAGLCVLFIVDRGFLGQATINGAHVQIAVGIVALLAAALLTWRLRSRRPLADNQRDSAQTEPGVMPARVDGLLARVGKLVQSDSTRFAATIGVVIALPSVDYLALLLVIATSGASWTAQVAALFMFLLVANMILIIPLGSHLLAPEWTKARLESLRTWVLARRRLDYAILLAFVGCLMIAMGVGRL